MPPSAAPPKDNHLPATTDPTFPVQAMLQAKKKSLTAMLGKMLNPDRFMALVVNACRETPGLLKCSADSLFFAVKDSAELGLEPNTALGHGWLIPFGPEATFVPGYKGFVWKVWDCSQIEMWATNIYEGESYSVEEGTDPKILHKPDLDGDRSDDKIRYVYAVAKLPNGSRRFCVMTRAEVDKIRDGSRGFQAYKEGKAKKCPWVTSYPEMCKKTAARRLVKYLPIANEKFSKLLEVDDKDYQTVESNRVIESGPAVKRSINLTPAAPPPGHEVGPDDVPPAEDPFQGAPPAERQREPGED